MSIEYKTFQFDQKSGFLSMKIDAEGLQQQLNKYGQSGWSLASSTNVGSQHRPNLLIVLQRTR